MGITQWWCGGCESIHGWTCRYFGHPGTKHSAEEIKQITKRIEEDWKAGLHKKCNIRGEPIPYQNTNT